MAKKAKKSANIIDLRKAHNLWSQRDPEQWFEVFRDLTRERDGSTLTKGPHLVVSCPAHPDGDNPNCHITPSRGMVKCYSCQWFVDDPVRLTSSLRGKGIADAAKYLRQRLSLRGILTETLSEALEKADAAAKMRDKIAEFLCGELAKAFALWPNVQALAEAQLSWCVQAIDWLHARFGPAQLSVDGEAKRGEPLWPEACAHQLVGVLAPLACVQGRFGVDSAEFKFYSSYFDNALSTGSEWVGAVVFPWHDTTFSVASFRVRQPREVNEGEGHTASRKKMLTFQDGVDHRGWYGIRAARAWLGGSSRGLITRAWIFEGETSAFATIAQQIRRGTDERVGSVILAAGGGSAQSLDLLVDLGIERASIVGDHDNSGVRPGQDGGGGVNFVKRLADQTRSAKLSLEVFEWPEGTPDDTDPRDMVDGGEKRGRVLGSGYQAWWGMLRDPTRFMSLATWAAAQALTEIERECISDDDSKRQSGVAIEWGRLLHDPQEVHRFAKDVAVARHLDQVVLVRDIIASDEDEAAYVKRLADALRADTIIDGNESGALWLSRRTTGEQICVSLADPRAQAAAFAPWYGDVIEMVHQLVGSPTHLACEGEMDVVVPREVLGRVYPQYLGSAVRELAKDAPYMATAAGLVIADAGAYRDVRTKRLVSNFMLTPRRRIRFDDGEVIEADLYVGKNKQTVRFDRKALSARDALSRLLPLGATFAGSDANVQSIAQLLTSAEIPSVNGVRTLGHIDTAEGPAWLWSGGAITAEGESNQVVVVEPYDLVAERISYQSATSEEIRMVARDALPALLGLNDPGRVQLSIAWFIAAMVRPKVMEVMRHFPLLSIVATKGSGKTSLLQQLSRLAGFTKLEPFPCVASRFVFVRMLSATTSIPVILDEHKPTDTSDRDLMELYRKLRCVYNGEVDSRGRADQSVAHYVLSTPTVLAGEGRIADPAVRERCIPITLDKQDLEGNAGWQDAFHRVATSRLELLALPLVRHALRTDVASLLVDAKDRMKELAGTRFAQLSQRPRDSLAVVLMGLAMLEGFAKLYEIELATDAKTMTKAFLDEMLDGDGDALDAFDEYLSTCSMLAQTGDLKEGVHYAWINDKLHVVLSAAHKVYAEHCARTRQPDVTNGVTALKRIASEKSRRRGSYIVETAKQVLMTESDQDKRERMRCVVIDMEKATKLGIDDFPCREPRKHGGARAVQSSDKGNPEEEEPYDLGEVQN